MNIVVREAQAETAQLIADLTRAAWANKVAVTSSGHRETAVKVAQDLRCGGGFILEIDGEAVGSVRWLPLETEPDAWEILRMGILQTHRGHSFSQHLIEAVIHHGLDVGAAEIRLGIRHDQPQLLGFYSAFGFELAAELEYSHGNPMEPPQYVMRKLLKTG
jgi:ribosomal protein S18 acetylase RimI-like enzyme